MTFQYENAVVLALGSNLPAEFGSSQALLETALAQFEPAGVTILARSRWWRSAAWPDSNGPDYINGLAIVETRLSPTETLRTLHGIEARFGRKRGNVNAPRTLDLDLIAYGRMVCEGGDLTLPHPRAAQRLFVMGPLAEIAPDWRHPVSGLTARALAEAATVGCDAHPV